MVAPSGCESHRLEKGVRVRIQFLRNKVGFEFLGGSDGPVTRASKLVWASASDVAHISVITDMRANDNSGYAGQRCGITDMRANAKTTQRP